MSFADLKSKSGSFEKLQTELNKISTPPTHLLKMLVFGNQTLIRPVTVLQSFGFYHNLPMKICHGSVSGVMHLMVQVVGILKIH